MDAGQPQVIAATARCRIPDAASGRRLRLGTALSAILVLAMALVSTACSAPGSGSSDKPLALPIGQVQGDGATSPYLDQRVELQGVVTGNFVAGLDGFFMQDATGEQDGDPATSDGIFVVWPNGSMPKVRRGDRVRVAGSVVELGREGDSQTAVQATEINVLGRGAAAVTSIAQAPESMQEWERLEGMWLRIDVPLTLSGNEGLLRFGELTASFGSRMFTGTEVALPGDAARAVEADNQRRRLILDDNRDGEYPENLWFLPMPLSHEAPLRAGSLLHGAEGILQQHPYGWRLQLTKELDRIDQALRPPAPELPEGIRIASFNLLNWFNGDGQGRGFPTERGAQTLLEANRQRDKLVETIVQLKPDAAALMEVENDGFGRTSSLAQLVAALNTAWPEGDYRFVDAGKGPGSDVMRVAIIYRANRLEPHGGSAVLETGAFAERNRVPLAQSFAVVGAPSVVFTLAANHFKSKGSCEEATDADRDLRDGQSCWNARRLAAAQEFDAWMKSDPTGSGSPHVIALGDLNSYALEDPVRALRDAGWQDVFALAKTQNPYSFSYRGAIGRLDHALVTASLAPHVKAAAEWHINADESEAFDYATDNNRNGAWYAADPYRSSDHDPVIVVLDLQDKH